MTSWSFTAASRLNAKCQSALFRCALANSGGDGDTPGKGGLGDRQPSDPVRVVGGQGVADPHPGIVAGHGEQAGGPSASISATRSPARVPVSYPPSGLPDSPRPALVGRDDLEVPGQRRHHQPPGVPGLGPAVHQQQWRAVAADDHVLAQLPGIRCTG